MWLVLTSALGLIPLSTRVNRPALVDEAVAIRTSVKRLPGFLSESDIDAIHDAAATAKAAAVAQDHKTGVVGFTRDRQLREGGRTVYMNTWLKRLLPELHERMLSGMGGRRRALE